MTWRNQRRTKNLRSPLYVFRSIYRILLSPQMCSNHKALQKLCYMTQSNTLGYSLTLKLSFYSAESSIFFILPLRSKIFCCVIVVQLVKTKLLPLLETMCDQCHHATLVPIRDVSFHHCSLNGVFWSVIEFVTWKRTWHDIGGRRICRWRGLKRTWK